jgi:hypothetical protein
MAFMNLASTRVAVSSQPPELFKKAVATRRQRRWQRTVLEGVGTFLLLAGVAVGVLTIRFSLVLVHRVMP